MNKPAVIKMLNGDSVFCEIVSFNKDGRVVVAEPYIAELMPTTKGIQLALRMFSPFTDDTYFDINPANIVSVSTLDNDHLMMYGSALKSKAFNKMKQKIDSVFYSPSKNADDFDRIWEDLVIDLTKLGVAYNIDLPDYDVLQNQFSELIFSKSGSTINTLPI